MLDRLAASIHRRRRRVLIASVAFIAIAFAFGGPVFTKLTSSGRDFDDAASQSVKARKELERATGADPDIGLIALVQPGVPVRSSAGRAALARVVRTIREEPTVAGVYTAFNSRNPAFISRDGRSTYAVASFKPLSGQDEKSAAKRIEKSFKHQSDVRLGGPVIANIEVDDQVSKDLARAEMVGVPILFLLSLLFFRGLVAALLPFATGIAAIAGALLALRLTSLVTPLSIFAVNVVTGLGLGLAIDYSLFVVSRYREETERSGPGVEALRRTLATAGRTIVFSALTVAAAMAAMLAFPQRFLYSMALGGVFVSLLSAVSALVFLTALVAALGPRVNALAPERWKRAAARTARAERAGFWYRLTRFVMRRAVFVAVGSTAVLIALGLPFLGVKFTGIDATVLPKNTSARQVQDVISAQFRENETSPIYVVASAPRSEAAAVRSYADGLRSVPGVLTVRPPAPVGATTWRIDVFSKAASIANSTQRLVKEIRHRSAPFTTRVGGEAPSLIDLKSSIRSHLPIGLLIVALTTGILLFLLTGSVLLPIKTLILNVISLSATLGFLVLIFQDGRLEGILNYSSQHALNTAQPILIGAIAFALSTDYAVFLLTRIKEARDAGHGETESVAIGIERTGRIVTAAALLLAVAIGAFVTSKIVLIKELGLGVAFAVLLDASVVRALLVPSLMKMLGARNWWAPAPLRRLHDRIGVRDAA